MEPYRGEIQLPCDGLYNLGALVSAIDFLRSSLATTTTTTTSEEKESLELGIKIALSKIQSFVYVPKMIFENFDIDCLVGSGSFGRIWKARFYDGEEVVIDVALKQLNGSIIETPTLWKERDLLIKLKHERVCNIIGAFVKTDVFLVMDLCYGSVSKLKYRTNQRNAIRFAVHLLEAVDWLHSNNIVHADIKSDNCLINQSNNLVLSDFGSAFILQHDKEKIYVPFTYGSPGYLDREANEEHLFSKMTDIFSVACVLFEMDVRRHLLLYQNQEHTHELYADALRLGRVIGLPANTKPVADMQRENLQTRAFQSFFVHLIHKLIAPPETRLTARNALLDETLRILLNTKDAIKTSGSTPEKENDFVTKEYSMDKKKTFQGFYGRPGFQNPGLLTFYYDENQATPKLERAQQISMATILPNIDNEPKPKRKMTSRSCATGNSQNSPLDSSE